jgi:outer membrane autotransporter protein
MNFRRRARSQQLAQCCVRVLFATLMLQGAWIRSATAQTGYPAAPSTGCSLAGAIGDPNAQPCLFTLTTTPGPYAYNALEIAAARADDAAYASLLPVCGVGATAGGCTGAKLNLFTRLRELEDNAAQLLGIGYGPTNYSLNLSRQGVGFALRWTADEEFSAQSSMTNRFANNQLAAISGRLSTLRFLQTVRLARQDASGLDEDFAAASYGGDRLTGGAGGDPSSASFGRWSVFANGSYTAGSKAPTIYDDAFNFGGTQFSGGADVRLSPHLVVGILVDHVRQEADFDSSLSIASGGIWASGFGVAGYVQMDWDAAYLNASLGVQRLSINTTRVVAYPSNNPQISSVDTTFYSSTDATSLLLSGGGGYILHAKGFSAEPYLNAQYVHTRIGAFTESASGPDLGFAASAAGQNVTSLTGIAGLKFQYAFLPPFGVILPYAYGEFRREFRDPSQNVASQFSSTNSGDYFELPTDSIRPDYYEVGAGFSAVLPHGTQLYAQYMKVLQLQYYTDYVVSAGFRFEF